MKWGAICLVLITLTAGLLFFMARDGDGVSTGVADVTAPTGDALVAVSLPATFAEQEQIGRRAFDAACAACHGENAQGRKDVGPPLVHKIYEPGHHGDMAFVLAALNGVPAHHWKFGSMPPVEGITQAEVLDIVAYVRALQRENGIE